MPSPTAGPADAVSKENAIQEAFPTNLKTAVETLYPELHGLTQKITWLLPTMQHFLLWTQLNDQWTPQSDVAYSTQLEDDTHPLKGFQKVLGREVFRALQRMEALCLLCCTRLATRTDEYRYEDFTRNHPRDDRLSIESFQALRTFFRDHVGNETTATFENLLVASLIASVPLSSTAIANLPRKEGTSEPVDYPYDSVQFSGFTVHEHPDIYALTPEILGKGYHPLKDLSSLRLLKAFFPNSPAHWRHVFYLENKTGFPNASYTPRELRLWQLYWLNNLMGFEGHMGPGARFFTESVYQKATALNALMQHRTEDPTYDVFAAHIEQCRENLGVEIHNPDVALFVVRLCHMAGEPTNTALAEAIQDHLRDNTLFNTVVTPHKEALAKVVTYLPGFLGNVKAAWEQNAAADKPALAQTLTEAMGWATRALLASSTPITSFRMLNATRVKELLASDFKQEAYFNDKGEIASLVTPTAIDAPSASR